MIIQETIKLKKNICPICMGAGHYRLISIHSKSNTVYESRQKCENCMGAGIINELDVTAREA